MTQVTVTEDAAKDLDRLVRTHNLPASTRTRFAASVAPLAQFPELGAALTGRFSGRRFVFGPWRWMIVVYRYFPERNEVAVVRIFDGRTSGSPTASR